MVCLTRKLVSVVMSKSPQGREADVHGMHLGFSSLWRCMSGMCYCAATAREKRWRASISNQSVFTVGDLKTALRTVDGGFTEHSIVFQRRAG